MKKALAHLKSVSPYQQGKFIATKKTRDETHSEFEANHWRERMHVDEKGFVFIPPMSFKNCLSEAAKYKSIQIPGKGKSTYTKHFEAGILCVEPVVLPVKASDVVGKWLHVPSDGKRGGTTRVEKCFPVIPSWEGIVEFLVFDEIIDETVFELHLKDAGQFIGIGSFRPRNNGYYGRFSVEGIDWS